MIGQEVWEFDIKRALLLAEEMLNKAKLQGIDPRAVRVVAECVSMSCSLRLMSAGIIRSMKEDVPFHVLAQKLFKEGQEAQKREANAKTLNPSIKEENENE